MREYNIYDMILRGPADKPGAGDDDLDTSGILDEGDGDGEEHEEAHEEDGDEGESKGRRDAGQEDADGEDANEEDDQGADVLDGEGEEETLATKAKEKPAKRTLQDKFREQRDERRREKERADRVEAELAEMRAERQREKAQADAATEADQLALMTTDERVEYRLNKMKTDLDRQQAFLSFKTADEADKAAFEFKAKSDPRIAKRLERVETELLNARKAGMNFKREVVLAQVLGQDMLKSMNAPQKKPQGQKQPQRGKPPANGRGDSASVRRPSSSLEKRLANASL